MANVVRILITAKDEVSGEIDKIRDKAVLLSKTDIGKGMMQGAGIAAFGMIKGAALGTLGAVKDFATGSIDAAIEEEASIRKLTTSLKANVAGWNGNTDAIESTIKAQMRLGFSDEEQRDSMARLVAVTHDVVEAQRFMRAAMDLARFKGVSLAEATQALINIEGGRYRALGALIGSTKEITSSTAALAAIEKVAGGQAEELANTTGGKLLAAQIQINDKMDELGGVILPLVDHALGGVLKTMGEVGAAGTERSIARMDHAAWAAVPSFTDLDAAIRDVAGSAPAANDAVGDLGTKVHATTGDVDKLTEAWLANKKAMIDHKYSAKELTLELAITRSETKNAQRELARIVDGNGRPLKGHTWKEVNELKLEILRGQKRAEELTADLKATNNVGMGDVVGAIDSVTGALKVAGRAAGRLKGTLSTLHVPTGGNTDKTGNDAGGFIAPYGTSVVGENRAELITVGAQGAYVNPSAAGRGGGSPVVIQLQLDGRTVASVVDRHLYNISAAAPQSPYTG